MWCLREEVQGEPVSIGRLEGSFPTGMPEHEEVREICEYSDAEKKRRREGARGYALAEPGHAGLHVPAIWSTRLCGNRM